MKSKRRIIEVGVFFILVSLFVVQIMHETAQACSTALWSPEATRDGTAMLWKNRDTDTLSNKVVFVPSTPLAYVGLADADTPSGNEVWVGLNQDGLGIMNSVAYNLPAPAREAKDREGLIMAEILRTCHTVDEAESYIRSQLGAALGSQANFGIMDKSGNVILLEVHNHGVHRINVAEAPLKYLVNTNFARSGETDKGAGYVRFQRVTQLLAALPLEQVAPQVVFENLARDVGHPLLNVPSFKQLEQLSESSPVWTPTNDTINRAITSAAVVIQGRKPGETTSRAMLWVALGEPMAALAIPIWVEAGETPAAVREGKDALLYLESLRLQKRFRPYAQPEMKNYINLTRLANSEGSGLYTTLTVTQQQIFDATASFLKGNPSNAELAPFQNKMADLARAALARLP